MSGESIDNQIFFLYQKLIDKIAGIHFNDHNRVIFESKLKERLSKNSMSSMEYYHYLQQNEEEFKIFLDSLTTNLTSFFRNQSNWDSLQNEIIPDLVEKVGKGRPIRIWSAGCSTGEEPYTIAMMCQHYLPQGMRYKIIACDISLKSLETAVEGFYTIDKVEKIPPIFLNNYFTKEENGYRVKPDLKKNIVFDYHNLMNPMYDGNFDLIICRNVLIYFDKDSFLKVIRQFYNASNPHAYLILGHSETLFNLNTGFYLKKGTHGFYYTKKKE